MKRFFYPFCLCVVYLCFVYFLPLATHAKPNGEIIFRHQENFRELWIGDVNNGGDTHLIFRQELLIMQLSIQKDDIYLVAVAERFVDDGLHLVVDAYLLDRRDRIVKEKNLTRGLFGEVLDAVISQNGDVVFTNRSFRIQAAVPRQASGIYLIPNSEIRKPIPQVELLLEVDADYVDWAPNTENIAFNTAEGIFLFDTFTKKVSQITKDGHFPVFSPDGKRLAFLTRRKPTKLGIISLANLHNLKHIEIEGSDSPIYLTWSPDGRYIVYTLASRNLTYSNFAVPITGGPPERILEMYAGGVPLFEWTHTAKSVTHAVKPENKLTTLWGKLKQPDLK